MTSQRDPPAAGSGSQDDFLSQVEQHIAKHPLTHATGGLASNALRFCVAKLLLRDQLTDWPGQRSERLCAIMLVLFVRECLVGSQTTVFGFDSHEFYEILSGVIRDERVSREALMAELNEIDVDGATLLVANSSEFLEQLWCDDSSRPCKTPDTVAAFNNWLFHDSGEMAIPASEWSDSLLPEAARASSETLFGGEGALAVVRQKLFVRSLRFRLACAAVSILWFFAVEFAVVSARGFQPAALSR